MKNLLLIISILLFFVGCSKEESGGIDSFDSFLTVSTDTLWFGPEGGELDVKIESSGDWTLLGEEENWISISKESGSSGESVTFVAEPNETGQILENVYKVFTGSTVQKIVVMSDADYSIELISEESYQIASDATTLYVYVKTNIPNIECKFTDGGEKWIEYKGYENSIGAELFIFNVNENESFINRSSTITLFGKDKELKFDINQKQLDAVIIEEELYQEYDLAEREIKLNLRTNIDYTIEGLPEWIELESTVKGEIVDGLEQQILTLKLAESTGSRVAELLFNNGDVNLLKVTIKQKNPNPEMVTIPDANFRNVLAKNGFIVLSEGDDSQCELLEAGKNATLLNASSLNIASIEGIEHFVNLKTINLTYNNIENLDISKLTNVETLYMESIRGLKCVKLGVNPIKKLQLKKAIYSNSVIISGEKLEEIDAFINFGDTRYDEITELDVTGCTALKKCDTRDRGKLASLYVTSEQKENVELRVSYKTSIVVRD